MLLYKLLKPLFKYSNVAQAIILNHIVLLFPIGHAKATDLWFVAYAIIDQLQISKGVKMKRFIILFLLASFFGLSTNPLMGCNYVAESDVIITEEAMEKAVVDSNGIISKKVTIYNGDILTITLYSHLGAGMRWSYKADESGVVALNGVRELIPDVPSNTYQTLVGGPGKEVWTFKGLGSGSANITMTYGSVVENGPQNVNCLELVVEVK